MGLYKRGKVWWIAISHQGKQIRRPTGTANRKLAEIILAKVTVNIVEGRFFDTLEEKERTFDEMMDRYMEEHGNKLASRSHYRGYIKNLLPTFGGYTLTEITPKLIVRYKAKRYADGVKPATINRELAVMKNVFNLAIREWEWCRDNPVSKVSMERGEPFRSTRRCFNYSDENLGYDQLRQILSFTAGHRQQSIKITSGVRSLQRSERPKLRIFVSMI